MNTFKAALLTATAFAAAPAAAQDVRSGAPATAPGTSAQGEGSTEQAGAADQASTDDIVVTAQRRRERVTEVPISITVADQAQLERQQVNTVNDLSRIAPSLEIQQAPQQNTGGGGQIRGIGTQTFNNGAVGSVGIVVDQVSQGNANIGDLFDVARIEVLKGPQGTLFGLTTSAGVINITTNAPDPDAISARVRTEVSGSGFAGSKFGNQIVQGVVNIPVSANSALRVSGAFNRQDGLNRNRIGNDPVVQNRYSVRGRYLWEPTSDLSINLIGDYTKSDSNGNVFFTFVQTDPTNTALLQGCGVTPREGNRDYCTSYRTDQKSENYGGSLGVEYDAGPFVLTSISAYRYSETGPNYGSVFRADPLALQVISGPAATGVKLYTQEFRVSSPATSTTLEYTAGAFISRQESVTSPEPFRVTLSPAPGVTIPLVNTPGARTSVVDESMAVFGQATVHVTDAFRLIAGGRYTGARLAVERFDFGAAAGVNPQINARNNFEKFSYRAGAQYQFTRDTMAYATASRGFKGAQIAIPQQPLLPYTIRPEIPTSYEAGIKSTLLGGLVMDLSGFYTKVKDFQGQQCGPDPVTSALACNQINIDGVKTRGAEINFFGRVMRGLNLNTGLIYTKATYPKGYIGADGTNIGDQQLANSPRWKFTASGEYEAALTDGFKGFIAGDAVWKSRIRYEPNSLSQSTYGPHWLLGGRLGVRDAKDRYSLSVFARNLLNKHEPILLASAFPNGGAANVGAIYGVQSFRQVGLQLDGKF